jgi:NAD(P)-dependent dehydrogenase (short-subunit alcohol dehydrogenase family)
MTTTPPVALVTGASSGIGRATAQALVDVGYTVVGTSRKAAKAGRLDGVTFLDLNVTDDESVRSLVAEVVDRFAELTYSSTMRASAPSAPARRAASVRPVTCSTSMSSA